MDRPTTDPVPICTTTKHRRAADENSNGRRRPVLRPRLKLFSGSKPREPRPLGDVSGARRQSCAGCSIMDLLPPIRAPTAPPTPTFNSVAVPVDQVSWKHESEDIDRMIWEGVIRSSKSEWASTVVLAPIPTDRSASASTAAA